MYEPAELKEELLLNEVRPAEVKFFSRKKSGPEESVLYLLCFEKGSMKLSDLQKVKTLFNTVISPGGISPGNQTIQCSAIVVKVLVLECVFATFRCFVLSVGSNISQLTASFQLKPTLRTPPVHAVISAALIAVAITQPTSVDVPVALVTSNNSKKIDNALPRILRRLPPVSLQQRPQKPV